MGHQVMFATGKHEVGPEGVELATSALGPILIRRRAWLASRCIILGGVTVGEGSVVGAGAVVTKSIPDHEFWAGNPARLVKSIGSQSEATRGIDGIYGAAD